MSRIRLAGLALLGLAACTSASPHRQTASRSSTNAHESTTASPSRAKPVSSPATARATARATTTPARRTTTTRSDTASVNPLTNH